MLSTTFHFILIKKERYCLQGGSYLCPYSNVFKFFLERLKHFCMFHLNIYSVELKGILLKYDFTLLMKLAPLKCPIVTITIYFYCPHFFIAHTHDASERKMFCLKCLTRYWSLGQILSLTLFWSSSTFISLDFHLFGNTLINHLLKLFRKKPKRLNIYLSYLSSLCARSVELCNKSQAG